jgi:hypothetical protein
MRTLLAALFLAASACAQDPLLWGRLEPGPYSVGFHSSIALDGSRKYDGRRGRPILLDVWYPAVHSAETGLAYAQYLRIPKDGAHPWFQERLESYIRDVVRDDLFHTKAEASLDTEGRAGLARLLTARTTAHLDAAPVAGRFPVVLYHSGAGGSFEDNSVLFEYLASNGYVVVSSAFQSPFPELIGNNIGGIERSGPDLDFIAAQVRGWPYADAAKLAAMGHSAGAQNMMLWIGSRNCPARALVSLDTTMEYDENLALHKLMRDAMAKRTGPRIPVILFAQADRNPGFRAFDRYLRDAPHYEARVAGVSHDGFVMHGYLGRALLRTPDAESVRRSYEELCRTIRVFLDATLKGDGAAAQTLEREVPGSPIAIRYRPPVTRN